jgi:hypothetical protein
LVSFCFERELVVSLSPYFADPSIELVDAWLELTVYEHGLTLPETRYIKVWVSGAKVYETEGSTPITARIPIPVTYLSTTTQFRVEYGAPRILTWLFGATLEGAFYIRYRKYLERGEAPEEALEEARQVHKEALEETFKSQGYEVKDIKEENGRISITVETPEGKTETKDIWTQFTSILAHLPYIIIAIFIIFLVIELLRVFRR